jgi:8-oxo-dGTP diphosphatase
MTVVRAAGGLVVRNGRVLLVHRPKYDDWSFPKGKCADGEADEACALREVEEETGLRCELLEELGETSYRDGRGRPKVVRYWRMRAVEGEFVPADEVDEIRWVTPEAAAELLSWSRDRALLESL